MPVQDRYSKFLKDQRQIFDEMAVEDRDSYFNKDWDFTRTFEVEQLFKRVSPSSVLDIGCGDGFRDKLMAEYPHVSHVDAFDYSEKSVQMAEEVYPHSKVNRFVADFSSFKPKRKYDLIVSFQVFEHLFNPEQYMQFCLENCAPNGMIAICTPNRLTIDNRINLKQNKPLTMIDVMHYKEYIPSEIFDMGEGVGLKPQGYFGHTIFSYYWIKHVQKLTIVQRTWLGYYFPLFANVIFVLLKKNGVSRK